MSLGIGHTKIDGNVRSSDVRNALRLHAHREFVVAMKNLAACNEMHVTVEKHTVKERGSFCKLQGARFASVNQVMEASYLRRLYPEIFVRRVKVGPAEQLKGHHIAASTVPAQQHKRLFAGHRAMKHSVGARFAQHAEHLGKAKAATLHLPHPERNGKGPTSKRRGPLIRRSGPRISKIACAVGLKSSSGAFARMSLVEGVIWSIVESRNRGVNTYLKEGNSKSTRRQGL